METIADRLNKALDTMAPAEFRGDRKAFQGRMRNRMEGTREGTSYPAVLGYFAGKVTPSVEWLVTAAELLRVRSAWLIVGHGAPTEQGEAERGAVPLRDPRQVQRTTSAVLATFSEAARLKTYGLDLDPLVLASVPYVASWIGPTGLDLPGLEDEEGDQEGHRRYVEAARMLGRAVAAPLDELHLDPSGWTQGEKAQYLTHALPTLATLVDLQQAGPAIRGWAASKPDQEED